MQGTVKPKTLLKSSFYFLLILSSIALLWAINPKLAEPTSAYVEVDACAAGDPATGNCFNPGDVTINVGENVHWQHVDLGGATHWIKSGDYEGRPCYDSTFVGGDTSGDPMDPNANTEGLMTSHEDAYIHVFPAPGGNCYYRCIFIAGMQGVVRVI